MAHPGFVIVAATLGSVETPMSFDVITVGGGLAGSSLATELAPAGHKVLVLTSFVTVFLTFVSMQL
jgi:ribulose 1,5-bisphosphate synthetase/thiazole synthase